LSFTKTIPYFYPFLVLTMGSTLEHLEFALVQQKKQNNSQISKTIMTNFSDILKSIENRLKKNRR
jgi:hypothetical protein